MTEPAAPIVVNPSPVKDQIAAGFRTLIVLIGGISAMIGFLGKHDLAGLIVYLQSGSFVPIIGAASAVGAFVYAQWQTIRRKRTLVTVTAAAPDDVAVVAAPPSP